MPSFRTILIALSLLFPAHGAENSICLGIYENAISAADPGDMTVTMNVFLDKIKMNEPVVAKRYRSRSAFLKALKNNEIDIAPLETFQYLDFNEEFPLIPAIAPVVAEDIAVKFLLLTHHKGNALDLTGKHTMILEQRWHNNLTTLWLTKFLEDQGLPAPAEAFKRINQVDKSSKAVLPVFFQQQDYCIASADTFKTMSELNPQIEKRLRIIAKSPAYLPYVLCVRASMAPDRRKTLIDELLAFHHNEEGRQILLLSKATHFQAVKESDLESLKALAPYRDGKSSPIAELSNASESP